MTTSLAERTTSFSELSALAQCEAKWLYRYSTKLPDRPGAPLLLGSLLGWGCREMWETGDRWDDVALDEEAWRLNGESPVDWSDEPWATARWLLTRYWLRYGDEFPEGEVTSELHLTATLPSGLQLQGYFDHLIDGHVLVERKSMKDWGRLNNLIIDPQVSLYFWLARENGYAIDSVLYDAIKTYRWKRDEHPPADSFQQVWLDRTEFQIERAIEWAESILARRSVIVDGAYPIRNLGPLCNGCPFQDRCHDDLAFAPGGVIEVLP